MPKIRLLTSVQGDGPVYGHAGDILDVPAAVAKAWCDGERAERVRTPRGSAPEEIGEDGICPTCGQHVGGDDETQATVTYLNAAGDPVGVQVSVNGVAYLGQIVELAIDDDRPFVDIPDEAIGLPCPDDSCNAEIFTSPERSVGAEITHIEENFHGYNQPNEAGDGGTAVLGLRDGDYVE